MRQYYHNKVTHRRGMSTYCRTTSMTARASSVLSHNPIGRVIRVFFDHVIHETAEKRTMWDDLDAYREKQW